MRLRGPLLESQFYPSRCWCCQPCGTSLSRGDAFPVGATPACSSVDRRTRPFQSLGHFCLLCDCGGSEAVRRFHRGPRTKQQPLILFECECRCCSRSSGTTEKQTFERDVKCSREQKQPLSFTFIHQRANARSQSAICTGKCNNVFH